MEGINAVDHHELVVCLNNSVESIAKMSYKLCRCWPMKVILMSEQYLYRPISRKQKQQAVDLIMTFLHLDVWTLCDTLL